MNSLRLTEIHTRPLRATLGLALGLALLCAPAAAGAAAWNQERVTQYAEELVASSGELAEALGKRPTYVTPVNQRAFYQARDDVRTMHHVSERLHSQLKDGEGMEATLPTFKRLQLLRRAAEENGRKAAIPDDIMAKATPVGGALNKLRPYYETEEDATVPE